MPDRYLFQDSEDAVRAVQALRKAGIRATRVGLHHWPAGVCVSVRDPLETPQRRTLESLGGERATTTSSSGVQAPAPARRRRRWLPRWLERGWPGRGT